MTWEKKLGALGAAKKANIQYYYLYTHTESYVPKFCSKLTFPWKPFKCNPMSNDQIMSHEITT